jgi:hypothetical protein
MESPTSERREHEEGIVDAFLTRDARRRARELLWSSGRSKWTSKLAHSVAFDGQVVVAIPANSQTASKIEELLRVRGAPATCWLVSERSEFDERQMLLADALEAVVGAGFGTLISCIPGRLGYFEGEGPENRHLLERRA